MQSGSCRFHDSVACISLRVLLWRLYSHKEPVPFVMFSRRGRPPAFKRSAQHLEIGNSIHVYPAPIRKLSTTGAADLVAEEPHTAFLYFIVMRFENPILVTITKPNHAPVLNGRAEQLIDVRFGNLHVVTRGEITATISRRLCAFDSDGFGACLASEWHRILLLSA